MLNAVSETSKKTVMLWAGEIGGGAAAALLFSVFLIPSIGIIPCVILLTLMRIGIIKFDIIRAL